MQSPAICAERPGGRGGEIVVAGRFSGEGRILALNGEAGYQAELLRGGMHFGLWRGQYKVHKVRLVTIAQGKIGYVYARDGEPLTSGQTLARRGAVQQFSGCADVFAGPGERRESVRATRTSARYFARRRVCD